MLEQWFLDLDGVRSGPYQTSEVMSLVAEGEVLPHHLISTELKSQNWTTILEWRLAQNKVATPQKTSTVVPSAPEIPVQSFDEPNEETTDSKIQTSTEPETYEISGDSVITQEPERPAIPEPIKPEPSKPQPTIRVATSGRDPMAEMFDMLQNSKHKREQKNQQQHQPATHPQAPSTSSTITPTAQPSTPPTSGSNEILKLVVGGIIVIIIGFALGQYFQKANRSEPNTQAQTIPANTPKPDPTIAEPTPTREVVDRTNEKITIRSHVPVSQANHRNEDMQDIKDLKKELMELKALKEEIRNNAEEEPIHNNGNSDHTSAIDSNAPAGQPGSTPWQATENTGENPNPDANGINKEDQDVHY